ncbi:hypothetical protein SAMN05216436_1305 [bacterium A37T11]|nr:hypothetical protein SAMN05216436_1305 [bacterium A37T11]
MNTEELIYIEMSELDYQLILHVKELRRNKFTQQELSLKMGMTKSFVGNVEQFLHSKKYNIRHLTLIAKAFGYKSISKLFDFPTPEHDWVRLTLRITPALKKDGTPSKEKKVEVIKVEPVKKGEGEK